MTIRSLLPTSLWNRELHEQVPGRSSSSQTPPRRHLDVVVALNDIDLHFTARSRRRRPLVDLELHGTTVQVVPRREFGPKRVLSTAGAPFRRLIHTVLLGRP